MSDGIKLTVRREGVDLEGMVERLVDHRPAWEALGDLLLQPSAYEGGRISGRGTMPRPGAHKRKAYERVVKGRKVSVRATEVKAAAGAGTFGNDSVGYIPHLRLSKTKRMLRTVTTRMTPPPVTDATDDKVTEAAVDHVIGADAPTTEEVLS